MVAFNICWEMIKDAVIFKERPAADSFTGRESQTDLFHQKWIHTKI